MADLSITAAEVQPGTGAIIKTVIAGEAITQAMPIYLSGGKAYKCDADTATTDACVGLSLNSAAADGQPISYQSEGLFTIGATAAATAGTTYVVSTTAGGIAPQADLLAGDYVTVLGTATAAGVLKLAINVTSTTI